MQTRPTITAKQPAMASDAPPASADECKHFATLRARAALAGWVLAEVAEPDGSTVYSLTRWGRPRMLPSLAQVAGFLRQVEGRR